MDRLDEFDVFIAILDAGSLAGAARKLRRSAPAITRSLAALEQRIGVRLVERTTRRLAPTDAGKRLGEQARAVLAAYDEAVREDAGAPLRGLLRVTAPTVFGRRHVAPIVNAFLDHHRAVQVELVVDDYNLDLIEEGIDVAVRIGPLPDAGLVARRVGQVRRVLVASRGYLAQRGAPDTPADIAAHDVIFSSLRRGAPEWRFQHDGRDSVVHLAPRLIVNDVDGVLLALHAGRGLARLLSYQVADGVADGSLVRLLTQYEPAPLPVHVVVPSARHMAPKLRAFVDYAVARLEQLDVIGAAAGAPPA
ncbi:MAG: LysR family transcriptional regulator [Pseudomonadota bacterium]